MKPVEVKPEDDRIARARESLDSLLEVLRPFLPAPDAPSPEPASEWDLGEEADADPKAAKAAFAAKSF